MKDTMEQQLQEILEAGYEVRFKREIRYGGPPTNSVVLEKHGGTTCFQNTSIAKIIAKSHKYARPPKALTNDELLEKWANRTLYPFGMGEWWDKGYKEAVGDLKAYLGELRGKR